MSGTPRILWASPNTLLDSANGAALMVRECLEQLHRRGCEIAILGATVFVNPQGMGPMKAQWAQLQAQGGQFVALRRGALTHRLLVTQQTQRRLMRSFEEQRWFDEYCRLLDNFAPQLVLFFDRSLITLLTASEARARNIPVGVFLMHGRNTGNRWSRDVTLMLTDTQATASMYRRREGYSLVPLGTFIDPAAVKATPGRREHLLFVNPIPEKGVVPLIQLLLYLQRHRPDIPVEVVDTRGTWQRVHARVAEQLGVPTDQPANLRLTQHTVDMRPVYGRARVLFVPSLWWESGPRVIVEALSNGIPVIGSESGGIPEITGDGGVVLKLPAVYYQPPYTRLLSELAVAQIAAVVERFFDDASYYDAAVRRATAVHRERHCLKRNADRLWSVIQDHIEETSAPRRD